MEGLQANITVLLYGKRLSAEQLVELFDTALLDLSLAQVGAERHVRQLRLLLLDL